MYESINNYEKNNKIVIDNKDNLKTELKCFGIKKNVDYSKNVLTKKELFKLKSFMINNNISIRKADKSNSIVIIDKSTYIEKIENIVANGNKFKKLKKDNTMKIKKSLNNIITSINSTNNNLGFNKLIGNYKPGYIYANPKIHKNKMDPPYRPIISQIGTPTYEIAKNLNKLLNPYLDKKYMVESTYELLNILRSKKVKCKMASIDVENLFTNVPVKETTEIIIDKVFNNDSILPPKHLSEDNLRKLLLICTTETSFKTPNNEIYQQIDGVSMGSPLGPLYANFYMSMLENKIIPNLKKPPILYLRYVDDTLLLLDNFEQLYDMIDRFKQNSVLNFTSEIEKNEKINFLDVNIDKKEEKFITSVFTKPTSSDDYINYMGCCPKQYKVGVIKTLLYRAYHICGNYELLDNEFRKIKQKLVNNNFPIQLIDKTINNFLTNINKSEINKQKKDKVTLLYKNQMTSYYKEEEKHLKKIIAKYIKPKTTDNEVEVRIYYKTKKLKNLLIKNNLNETDTKDHVVYEFKCPENGCNAVSNYIGHTTNALEERLKQHIREGSIKQHMKTVHNKNLEIEKCLNNTVIIGKKRCRKELVILESILIKTKRPIINIQTENFHTILQIF